LTARLDTGEAMQIFTHFVEDCQIRAGIQPQKKLTSAKTFTKECTMGGSNFDSLFIYSYDLPNKTLSRIEAGLRFSMVFFQLAQTMCLIVLDVSGRFICEFRLLNLVAVSIVGIVLKANKATFDSRSNCTHSIRSERAQQYGLQTILELYARSDRTNTVQSKKSEQKTSKCHFSISC
jgi:hypothetical protein